MKCPTLPIALEFILPSNLQTELTLPGVIGDPHTPPAPSRNAAPDLVTK